VCDVDADAHDALNDLTGFHVHNVGAKHVDANGANARGEISRQ